ncbi:hypothetical protein D3C77_286400 [compost metagenome]
MLLIGFFLLNRFMCQLTSLLGLLAAFSEDAVDGIAHPRVVRFVGEKQGEIVCVKSSELRFATKASQLQITSDFSSEVFSIM